MWGAIKSDLFEFISTVQEDAQDTISKVVDIPTSRTAADNDKITEDERILSEFRNNLATYAEDVDTEQLPEFEKFIKSFSLSSKADEIEYILELESGVTKHYASLVPTQLTPDLFWARYFFKVNILVLSNLDSVLESAYDEEEELSWGEEEEAEEEEGERGRDHRHGKEGNKEKVNSTLDHTDETSPSTNNDTASQPSTSSSTSSSRPDADEEVALLAANSITQLQEDNANLSTRADMLEREVEKLQNQLIKERMVSAKLRSHVTQGEEREKGLAEQVMHLKMQLAAAAAAVSERDAKEKEKERAHIESAPVSTSSSIVDLGGEQHSRHPSCTSPPSHTDASASGKSDDPLGPSISALSLASLQSVSSVSVSASGSGDSSPTSEEQTSRSQEREGGEGREGGNKSLSPSLTQKEVALTGSAHPKKDSSRSSDKQGVKVGVGGDDDDDDDDEEEEWDNEAWE